MTYEEYKSKYNVLETASKKAGDLLKSFPTGPMGLTPADVKATPDWRAANRAFNIAFSALRYFNGKYSKIFRKETIADIQARRKAKL